MGRIRISACVLPSFPHLLLVAAVSLLKLPSASAAYIYTGSTYNASADAEGCAYPVEASPEGICPLGPPWFDDDFDQEFAPPNVNVSASVVDFQGVDQQLFTFAVTVQLSMAWLDSRCVINTFNNSGTKCTKPCAKSPAITADCCDNMWLPTINLMNAVQKSVVEEDYTIQCYDNDNLTRYTTSLSATYTQNFDFTAYPFDQHALGVRVECLDCHMALVVGDIWSPSNVTSGGWLWGESDLVGGQDDASDTASFAATTSVSDNAVVAQATTFPESSGWRLQSAELAVVNITRTTTSTSQPQASSTQASSKLSGIGPDSYGVIFVIRTQRVTRIFYALQAIAPIIILSASSFLTFLVSKDKFVDRLKTLASLLVSIYLFQYTLTAIMPKTFTLLAPHYLIFCSMVLMLILIMIAAVSAVLVHRQDHFEWTHDMMQGKRKWQEIVEPLRWQGGKPGQNRLERTFSESSEAKLGVPCSGTKGCLCDACQDKEADGGKAVHDDAVIKQAQRRFKRWPIGFRRFGRWWSALAMNDVQGYREHVALIWEASALAVAAALYIASVAAVIVVMARHGRHTNTA